MNKAVRVKSQVKISISFNAMPINDIDTFQPHDDEIVTDNN